MPLRSVDLIRKKRDGGTHSGEEMRFLVRGYAQGSIPDYQMSAWLMAVCWRGLSEEETFALTGAMVDSGETLDLSAIAGITVDKHSTGGVGDKTTLAVVPILASAGVPVAKMSGRGLGHTGGTLDKLESIPGTRTALSTSEIIAQVQTVGACLCAQTDTLVPADRKLYALRDATATVESLPLIAASIMSKKIAGGGQAILLDVKVGGGAFMKTLAEGRALAALMIKIGEAQGRRVVAVLSDMTVPLGRAIGNRIEIEEAAELLRHPDNADRRFKEIVVYLAAAGLLLGGRVATLDEGRALALRQIGSGAAFEKLCATIAAQGGDVSVIMHPDAAPAAPITRNVTAPRGGFILGIDANAIGLAAMRLGAGRETKDAVIDPAAGILLRAAVGDLVDEGAPLATLMTANEDAAREAGAVIADAFTLSDVAPEAVPLIYETLNAAS